MSSHLSLICLKARAWLDLKERKEAGERVDSKNVKKHRLDILRLAVMLTEHDKIELPERIKGDMRKYMENIQVDRPDMNQVLNSINLPANTISLDRAIELLQKVYSLNEG